MNNNKTFFERVKATLDGLVELKIQTVVGKAKLVNDKVEFGKNAPDVEAMVSRIGLIDGDVKTEITEKFLNEYDQF